MKKAAFKTKIEDKFDAFFDNEHASANAALQNFDNNTIPSVSEKETFAFAHNPWANFLKQALLFFPGTFILFYVSLATSGLITELLKGSDRHFIFEPQLIFIYLFAFLSTFSTWFGLGDLKNKKHFVIPGSIILSGAVIGVAVVLTENLFWLSKKIIVDFGYAVWLFPIGLIVPFLAKSLVDRKSESN